MQLGALDYAPLNEKIAPDLREQIDCYGDLLFTQAMPAGFIGECSRAELVLRHLLDSLLPAIAPESGNDFPLWQSDPLMVFDLGTGAGLPALPLALLFPQHHFHLIDAQEKRLHFCKMAASKLELKNVHFYHGVVQDFPKKYAAAPRADVVLFRAFRKILASLELALFVLPEKPGTRTPKILYWRSQKVPFSEAGLQRVRDLGYNIDTFIRFVSAERLLPRGLYQFSKLYPTAKPYPRPWKKIAADRLVETES